MEIYSHNFFPSKLCFKCLHCAKNKYRKTFPKKSPLIISPVSYSTEYSCTTHILIMGHTSYLQYTFITKRVLIHNYNLLISILYFLTYILYVYSLAMYPYNLNVFFTCPQSSNTQSPLYCRSLKKGSKSHTSKQGWEIWE